MTRLSPSPRKDASLLIACVLLGLAACKDKEITTYRIPKDADGAAEAPAAAQEPAAASPAEPPAAAPEVHWSAPAAWQQQPASGMRQASFTVPGSGGANADVSVVSFPGAGGDDLANINRWRGQVSLAALSAGELPSQIREMKTEAGTFVVADFAGTAGEKGPTRILGAWLRQPERVWFFKIMGPSDLVEAQKDAFDAFLRSISLEGTAGGARASVANTNDLPQAAPAPKMPSVPAKAPPLPMAFQSERGASLVWTAPDDWKVQTGNAMRKGSYSVGNGAEVAITAFPGDVGGALANINLWREQAGLDPVDEAGLAKVTTSFDSNGLHFLVLDATAGPRPIVAVIVPWGGGTWFFKLQGAAEGVTPAKPAFLSFLRTVKTP
jgi:hypothetical protein